MQNTNIHTKITEEAILQAAHDLQKENLFTVQKKEKFSLLGGIGKFLNFINPFKRKPRIVYQKHCFL